jgi:hypothetical protein
LRDPRLGFFSWDWRVFIFLRFGLLMMNVPLPTYSALYNFSSANSDFSWMFEVRIELSL